MQLICLIESLIYYKKESMIKKIITCFGILATTFAANAQIAVTNTQTPYQLVQDVLLGFGVTATNISVNGNLANANSLFGNATYFNAGSTTFPIPSGVLLTTGNGDAAIGPNSSGSYTDNSPATTNVSTDVHLNDIANGSVTNGIVLEFDFIPGGDTISFNYIFGSDEYPEFSPSSFNDAFGFFLWGPGISGPYALTGYPAGGANLAVIPGTSIPVTINNLGPGATQYPQFYQNNLGGAAYGTAIQYDGTTTLLSANASVQCGETYHIKLCISNVGDQSYDSGVFLQANSFSSNAIEVSVATVTGDTTIFEGCTTADFIFVRPENTLGDTLNISYDIAGTATEGTDYPVLPNVISFLPGEDSVVLTINPGQDGTFEGFETVIITVEIVNECGDTITSSGTIWINDEQNIDITENDPLVKCISDTVLLTASATGGYPPYTYSWSNGDTNDSTTVNPTGNGVQEFYITVTDFCNYSNVDTVTMTVDQTLSIDSVWSDPATCLPEGIVYSAVSGDSITPQHSLYYHWNGPGANNPTFWLGSTWTDLSSGWYYLSVEDAVCITFDSVFVDMEEPPMAQFTASPVSGCDPLTVTFTNSSENTDTYQWTFGNGNSVTVYDLGNQIQTYNTDATIRLIASKGNCADTAYATVTIVPCGCTDPAAINYDQTAVVDDGSCIYPEPIVDAPNVFSPNGDGSNELFFLTTQFSTSIDLTILNRWGNVVYESSGPNPAWNGKLENGNAASDGVYFYKYVVYGMTETKLEGHGFFHLVR